MATWQADFTIVSDGSWPSDYRTQLDAIAARTRSWNSALEVWGEEEGNRVDVWLQAGSPTEAQVRVDLRTWDARFIAGLVEFVQAAGFHFVDAEGRRVAANLGEVALALRGSAAFRFVEDPERFLRRLQVGGLEDA